MEAWDVVVIGAGAAGLLAATHAAERHRKTLLLEKNRKPGVKILMSGGTRCNLTQATDRRGIVAAFGAQGRFLHSALAALDPQALVALVEAEGVATKVEPTGKIFPASDRAADVLAALLNRLNRSGCQVVFDMPCQAIAHDPAQGFRLTTGSGTIWARRVIVTTGGRSYPGCGTNGDGYAWAAQWGHTIIPCRPALTPITVAAAWVAGLKGVTVSDVGVEVVERAPGGRRGQVLAQGRGSMLFTHFGVSGPVVLNVSRAVSGHARPTDLELRCNFAPDLAAAELDGQWRELAASAGGRAVSSVFPAVVPRRLAAALLDQAGVPGDQRLAELAAPARRRLIDHILALALPISGTLGFEKAEVTAGGVSLNEVDSRTLESKLVPGLFFAGEVLDLDGPIGGYNFQAAFSTGWLAGGSV